MKQNKSRSGAEKLKDSLVEDVQKFVHDHPTNHGADIDLSEKTIFVDFEQHKVITPPPPPEESLRYNKQIAQLDHSSDQSNINHSEVPQQVQSLSKSKNGKTKNQFFDVEEPIDGFDSNVPQYQSNQSLPRASETFSEADKVHSYSDGDYVSSQQAYDPLDLPKAALDDDESQYIGDLFPDDKTQVIGHKELEKTVVLQVQHKNQSHAHKSPSKIELFEPPKQLNNNINHDKNIKHSPVAHVFAGVDALKIAQEKIKKLETEVDRLRADNDDLSSSAEVIKQKVIEYRTELQKVENDKINLDEILSSEIQILKSNLHFRDQETNKYQQEIDTLKARLKSDFKKIRVSERELENRLELLRVEKATLLKTKDEQILDLKRKIDQLQMENDNYRQKCIELNRTIEGNQDQFKRTVRALRLALTNLESKDPGSIKKAE